MKRFLLTLLLLLPLSAHAAEVWVPNTTDGTLRPVSKPGGGYYSIRLPDSDSSHFVTPLFGNITAARTFTIDLGDVSRTLTFTGNATVGGTNTGDQTITLTGDVTGSGTGTFAATIANDVIDFADMADSMTLDASLVINASASNFSVNIDSNTLFVDTANNRVGIGTATPADLFHVSGGAAVFGEAFAGFGYPLTEGRIAVLKSNASSTIYFGQSNIAYGVLSWTYNATNELATINLTAAGTHSVVLQRNGGLVGINDTTPDASLDITNDGVGDSFLVADTNDGDASPFVIQSDGDVGIGTGSPATKLDVLSANDLPQIRISDATGTGAKDSFITARSYSSVDADLMTLWFQVDTANTAKLKYGGGSSIYFAATEISFWTAANTATLQGTQRLTIDSAGNVGIGVVVPTARLQINGTANAWGQIVYGGGTTGQSYGLSVRAGTNTTDQAFVVRNVGETTSYFAVRGDGNVGIGTASPDSLAHFVGSTAGDGGSFNGSGSVLHLKQNSAWSGAQPWALFVEGYTYLNGFRINANDGIRALYKTASGGSLGFCTAGADPITFSVNAGDEVMRVAPGVVGILDTSPDARLEIVNNGTMDSFLVADDGDGDSTPFVIQADGDVGIGTTAPNRNSWTKALTVAASDRPGIELFGNKSGSDGSVGDIVFLNDSHSLPDERIAAIQARRYGSNDNGALGFSVYGGVLTERFTILPGGAVGVDDVSPDAALDVTNDGISDSFRVDDTGEGDSTPFVIKSDGKIGIGVTAPTYFVEARRDQNANTNICVINEDTGALAQAVFVALNSTNTSTYGITSSGYGGYGSLGAKTAYLYNNGALAFMADDASLGIIQFMPGGSAEKARFSASGNFGLGQTTFGTSATKTLAIGSGTAPSTSPADAFQMYSADIAAGEASPHFRTEDGDIIKLFQSAANADTTGATLGDLETEVNQLKTLLRDHGFLAP